MSDLTRASCCGRALILSAPTRASKILCTALAYPGEKSAFLAPHDAFFLTSPSPQSPARLGWARKKANQLKFYVSKESYLIVAIAASFIGCTTAAAWEIITTCDAPSTTTTFVAPYSAGNFVVSVVRSSDYPATNSKLPRFYYCELLFHN